MLKSEGEHGLQQLRLALRSGHLIASLGDGDWLLDTGSPISFGRESSIEIDGRRFAIAADYFGLNSSTLSVLVGEPLAGLIGTDVLEHLDLEIDIDAASVTASLQPLELKGMHMDLEEFMGVPILRIQSGEGEHRMFFDTGAQISYFQNDSLENFTPAGKMRDFFPGMGEFDTETHLVPFSTGPLTFEFRCGRLPDLLGLTLVMAGVEGIIGNEICVGRKLGFFPRRKLLVLA